ncbi:hypothetical protein [Methylophaga sulfidovorans]|uniref:Uncharacterized protein, PEP-CTERM system associated n=1 Tax=Methylophaga sulfidovorans TaxID=45496 RepID=A0A1I3XM31_9GAMM|nr:hypothetical protein [Methylophaga sulfidovorans]SFK20593.1 uncharacterized protein, PEP-CTERM system associated [Methylophaga sulfidovorans]
MRKYIPLLVPIVLINTASAAEWVFNAQADPKFKYDDNELLREDKLDDFSLNIDPTLSLSRSLENSSSEIRLGYRISRYKDLKELDKENPFASFSTSYATERSTYGLKLDYAERESRSIAEEDTADFSNISTTITKSISPSYSYRLTELDTISTSLSYQTRKQSDDSRNNNSVFGSSSNLTDNETASLNLAWQHQYTERLNGGLSFTYVNYQAESDSLDNEYDSYSLGLTSEYQLSELWSVNGLLGARYLDSENNPVVGSQTSDQSTGLDYSISTTREDELNSYTLSASRSLLPSSEGDVNEQDAYTITYRRNLTEKLTGNLSASYRKYRSADDLDSTETKYIDFSPSLSWKLAEDWSLVFAYRYRSVDESDGKNVDGNALTFNIDYNWHGIRFSR